MKKNYFLIFCILISIAFKAKAWGDEGHRIVAGIAYEMLNPAAKAKLGAMFRYGQVLEMANFPDHVKADTTHKYDKYSPWHYLEIETDNLKFSDFQKRTIADTVPNAYRAIHECIEQLKKNPADTFYLSYLIHIVGDIHQPLHVGRPSDQGGNKIMVTWNGTPTNLHAIWDNDFIKAVNYGNGDFERVLIDLYGPKASIPVYSEDQLFHWFYASYLRRTPIYASAKYLRKTPKANAQSSFFYIYYYSDTLYKSLYEGGVHLASVLNYLYGRDQ